MDGSGTNRRHGLHIMVDNPTLSNRGNNYLIWWRVDQNKLEVYRNEANVLTIAAETQIDVQAGVWYDYKVRFATTTGQMEIYRDDSLVMAFTDPYPFTTGSHIALRNGNSSLNVSHLRVYKERAGSSQLITVGNNPAQHDFFVESPDSITAVAQLMTIAQDLARQFTTTPGFGKTHSGTPVGVDYSPPLLPLAVNDGPGADIEYTDTDDALEANWQPALDMNSGINRYQYSIGTAPGATDIVNWADNALTQVLHTGLSLTKGTTYYINVRAVNGAGLLSEPASSNGQTYDDVLSVEGLDFTANWANTHALLQWRLADESGLQGYTLERSANGVNGFRSLGQFTPGLQANGWQYADRDFPQTGIYYYRLRLRYLNGTQELSPLQSVRVPALVPFGELQIAPNPIGDHLTYSYLHALPDAVQFRVLDIAGRILAEWIETPSQAGLQRGSQSAKQWAAGTYLLVATSGTQRISQRFVKD
jgi:hypothetical protein